MNTRDKIVNYALKTCCKIYKAKSKNIINNKNRQGPTIKAKRMFLFYLYNYIEIKHKDMKIYIKNLNHATSIHHVHKFRFEIDNYPEIKENFDKFLAEMKIYNIYGFGFYEKRKEIKKLLEEITND
jgi:hypothetical protein